MPLFCVEVNELEAETIRRIVAMHPKTLDIEVRKDAKEYHFQGDFVYRLKELP